VGRELRERKAGVEARRREPGGGGTEASHRSEFARTEGLIRPQEKGGRYAERRAMLNERGPIEQAGREERNLEGKGAIIFRPTGRRSEQEGEVGPVWPTKRGTRLG